MTRRGGSLKRQDTFQYAMQSARGLARRVSGDLRDSVWPILTTPGRLSIRGRASSPPRGLLPLSLGRILRFARDSKGITAPRSRT